MWPPLQVTRLGARRCLEHRHAPLTLSLWFGLAAAAFAIVLALVLLDPLQILGSPTAKFAFAEPDSLWLLNLPAHQPPFKSCAADSDSSDELLR